MVNLKINLEPNADGNHVFYTDEVLRGEVELSLSSPKSFRGCYVRFYGRARAHWQQYHSGRNKGTEYFESKEIFIDSKKYLFGNHGATSKVMEPGIYKYSFALQLPYRLPSTINVNHGNIKYHIEAVLDIPWRFDKEVIIPFVVWQRHDLNLYPLLRNPHTREETKSFCMLFQCNSEQMIFSVTIPCSGFAAGQKIPVKIKYLNRSGVKAVHTYIKLVQEIVLTAHSYRTKQKFSKQILKTYQASGVAKHQDIEFYMRIEIPKNIMNSNANFCRIIQVNYHLNIEAHVEGCHTNPHLTFPITIGSIPLESIPGLTQSSENPSASPINMQPQSQSAYNSQQQLIPSEKYNVGASTSQVPPSYQTTHFYIQPATAPVYGSIPSAPIDENDFPPSFEDAMKAVEHKSPATLKDLPLENIGWKI